MFTHSFPYSLINLTPAEFKVKALQWANQFRIVSYFDHNQIPYKYDGFENILAVSNCTDFLVSNTNSFSSLKKIISNSDHFWCGFFSYDLKNQTEKLRSNNPDLVDFPLIYFYKPEIYLEFKKGEFLITSLEVSIDVILDQIIKTETTYYNKPTPINIQARVSKEDYIKKVEAIRNNILEGDIYEMNYCMEFFAEQVQINPLETFWKLNAASPMPFAGYFKLQDKFLLCASPERFLKKVENKLISQPIKGTIRRGKTPSEDQILKEKLKHDEKEIAENMMIMDLVRNDLSKSSEIGSIKVEEMFGIYGFQQVFQMITTVTSTIRKDCHIVDAIKNAFPMGSMTGAPKIRAMELIEHYENTRRGLFSGSIGYIKPNGNFDFNVVIRSLQYNATTNYLSYMVGSAITYDAIPEQEYQECLLKAEAILSIL